MFNLWLFSLLTTAPWNWPTLVLCLFLFGELQTLGLVIRIFDFFFYKSLTTASWLVPPVSWFCSRRVKNITVSPTRFGNMRDLFFSVLQNNAAVSQSVSQSHRHHSWVDVYPHLTDSVLSCSLCWCFDIWGSDTAADSVCSDGDIINNTVCNAAHLIKKNQKKKTCRHCR